MTIEQFTSPTGVAILLLLALAFVKFGVWWAIIRLFLAPLLRPAGLLVAAAAVAVAVQFS